jgi:NAD+ synthase (glutamine-hydrolysing)
MGDISQLRLALCQVNPTVGAIEANEALVARGITAAREAGAELVVFGELVLSGYPPEDLLYKEHFLRDVARGPRAACGGHRGNRGDRRLSRARRARLQRRRVLAGGVIAGIYRKIHLPNYGVFDEQRYFSPGRRAGMIELDGRRIGLTICEDIWVSGSPCSDLARAGAGLIVNISASPYHTGRGLERESDVVGARVAETGVPCAFCALVGGQDELVFDGHSFVLGGDGTLLARAPQFSEELLICDIELAASRRAGHRARTPGGCARADRPAGTHRTRRSGRGANRPAARAARGRGVRGARVRLARLRAQERLPPRCARALGRDRLGARRGDRRRRARRRAGDGRRDALGVLLARDPGDARALAERSASRCSNCRSTR